MRDDPLGLVDRSAEHNDIVDVLLGARESMQRFCALALEPDATRAGSAPDERLLDACLGVCAVRSRLLRWLAVIEQSQPRAPVPEDRQPGAAGTLLR
ncbi:hypothetical protein [Piscinibacter koreensis]|uniref:Uncharacterized protein n=1 Tax=Piscinibacter koreensis TaxID=2742824 RepID=A0A7Y6NMP6_9BURK|nr:hypothetical protein [Schlegelella koreensis]NUZ05909.1 hypothetical protein [Schlegelella koreensis]